MFLLYDELRYTTDASEQIEVEKNGSFLERKMSKLLSINKYDTVYGFEGTKKSDYKLIKTISDTQKQKVLKKGIK